MSDIEAKTARRAEKRDSAYGDGPSSEIRDAGESIETGRCILRDEVVLLSERSRHVTRSVARLHLREAAREGQPAIRRVVHPSRKALGRTIMRTFWTGPMEPMKVRTPSCRWKPRIGITGQLGGSRHQNPLA